MSLPPGIFISIDLIFRSTIAGSNDIYFLYPEYIKIGFKEKKKHDKRIIERRAGAKQKNFHEGWMSSCVRCEVQSKADSSLVSSA